MLKRLLDYITHEDPQTDEKVVPELAAAALLFEVAWADQQIDDDEVLLIRDVLQKTFRVHPERLSAIIEETRRQHDESVGVFSFTRVLNESLDHEQKYQVLLGLWRVAFADANLNRFEEHTIRRIADLLYVSHNQFIRAKLAAKNDASH